MSSKTSPNDQKSWSKYAIKYDPIKCGSIDGTDNDLPHDKAIMRAINSTYTVNSRVTGDPDKTLFIGRLHLKTDEKTLKRKFKEFGQINDCRVVRDLVTGMSKCYGFLEFDKFTSAKEAFREMNKVLIDGSEIIVEFECERKMKGWKPRRLGGGFGGQRQSGQLRFGCRERPFLRPLDVKVSGNIDIHRKNKNHNK